jgi:hypothetical protein
MQVPSATRTMLPLVVTGVPVLVLAISVGPGAFQLEGRAVSPGPQHLRVEPWLWFPRVKFRGE